MKVIYIGDPIELERGEGLSRMSTTLYGTTFPMQAEVDVSHLSDVQKRKLLNNSHFRPAGVDAPPVPLVIPAAALQPAVAAVASSEDHAVAPAPSAVAGKSSRIKKPE